MKLIGKDIERRTNTANTVPTIFEQCVFLKSLKREKAKFAHFVSCPFGEKVLKNLF